MTNAPRITRDPDVQFGAPCFHPTRLTVRAVLWYARAGWTDAQIRHEFPSHPDGGAAAAIAYADAHPELFPVTLDTAGDEPDDNEYRTVLREVLAALRTSVPITADELVNAVTDWVIEPPDMLHINPPRHYLMVYEALRRADAVLGEDH